MHPYFHQFVWCAIPHWRSSILFYHSLNVRWCQRLQASARTTHVYPRLGLRQASPRAKSLRALRAFRAQSFTYASAS